MDDDGMAPTRQLKWQNVAAVILSGITGALGELSEIPMAVAHLLMADANYDDERIAFHEAAALEIETLTEED